MKHPAGDALVDRVVLGKQNRATTNRHLRKAVERHDRYPPHCSGASAEHCCEARTELRDSPENTILGVSATQLYAFKVKAGFSWKLKEPVGIWDRSAVQITATPGKATAQLRFDFDFGDVAELECQTLATNAGNLVFIKEVTGSSEF